MKKQTVRFLGNLVVIMATTISLMAQNHSEFLNQQISKTEIVVEGIVISQDAYKEIGTGNIYTLNKIRTIDFLKGMASGEILIRTNGGTVDGQTDITPHSPHFTIGEHGIYLINPTERLGEFQLSGGKFGKIRYLETNQDGEAFYEGTLENYKSWRNLKEQIGLWCGKNLSIPRVETEQDIMGFANQTELCVELANPVPLFETSQVAFDVLVKSNVPGLAFAGGEIIFNYPVEHLVGYIVANDGIDVTKGVVVQDADYSIQTLDVTEKKMKVMLETDCTPFENYYLLDTVFEKMLRVVVDVQDWGNLGTLNLDGFDVEGNAQYFLDRTRCLDFDNLCYRGEIVFLACEVTATQTSPYAAGIGQVITFTGTDFGNGIGGELTIPNPDDGGASDFSITSIDFNYIESWTETEIKVKISSRGPVGNPSPSPFGSGTWKINPDVTSQEPNTLVCFVDVDIDYALFNVEHEGADKMVGIAQNPANSPNGDYQWYIDSDISSDPVLQAAGITFTMVEAVAIQAFCDWEMETGINYEYMGGISGAAIGGAANEDNRTIISFANLDVPGFTRTRFSGFPCDGDEFFAERFKEADIQLNRETNWFVSTGIAGINGTGKMDMYSVLIHEIGHAILFGHAMDLDENNGTLDNRIMYFGLSPEQIKRDIDGKTKSGFDLLLNRTLAAMVPGRCFAGTTLNTTPAGCITSVNNSTLPDCESPLVKNLIAKGEIIELRSGHDYIGDVGIFSATGERLYFDEVKESSSRIATGAFPSGVYFIQYRCSGTVRTEKLVIQ